MKRNGVGIKRKNKGTSKFLEEKGEKVEKEEDQFN